MAENTDNTRTQHSKISLILKGAAMGIAEVIPGVSGGTIAFITGIYEDLIDTISGVDQNTVWDILKLRFSTLWESLNGPFLLYLIIGMVGGILTGVFGVTKLLENYPEALWALFFGLIIASIPLMFSQMQNRKLVHAIPFIIAAAIAYVITSISPAAGSTNLAYIFLAGVIAISAFVLPGISGSFILLLMGLYTVVIPTIKSFLESPELSELLLISVFALGCLTGLALFSRIVSAAFKNYHDTTIAIMSGFMFGSLNKIWPWRNPSLILNKETNAFTPIDATNINSFSSSDEHIKIVKETNVLPMDYFSDPCIIYVIAAFVVGIMLVGGLSLMQKSRI